MIMAQAKTELFEEKLAEGASVFKALAHPARLAILQYLAETKVCITGDISDELPLSRTTIVQHLKELKRAGLIQGRVEGAKVNYCIDSRRVSEAFLAIREFFQTLDVPAEPVCDCYTEEN